MYSHLTAIAFDLTRTERMTDAARARRAEPADERPTAERRPRRLRRRARTRVAVAR